MRWYCGLLTDEFMEFFSNEESVYFTVSSKGRLYNKTYIKFVNTVDHIITLMGHDKISKNFEDSLYYQLKDKDLYAYRLAESFFADNKRPHFSDVYQSIRGNVYNCDIDSLTDEQLAVGLTYPFCSRMGGSFEDDFAESGRLRRFLLSLYEKYKLLYC